MGGIIRLLGWTVLAAGLAMLMAWWHMGAAVVILLSGFGGNALLLPALSEREAFFRWPRSRGSWTF
jgi:hypothetical protein